MSVPNLISPLLDGFVMGDAISSHDGVRCCPAMRVSDDSRYFVKIISVPASQTKLDALLLAGAFSDRESAAKYFQELAQDVVEEAVLLQNVVAEAVEGAALQMNELAAAFALEMEVFAAVAVANVLVAGAAALGNELLHGALVNQLVQLTVYGGEANLAACLSQMLGNIGQRDALEVIDLAA